MKKMRRLIPAIAMLLVSAVMLSTASFAWFTLNDEVTASGMQIQAKADGSLLISDKPFAKDNLGQADIEVSVGVQNLKPMAFNGDSDWATLTLPATDSENNAYSSGWYAPKDNGSSHIATGTNSGDYKEITAASGYALKQEYYIATAGDPMNNAEITITLTAPVHPVTGQTHKAYAAAIYLVNKTADTMNAWNDNGDIDFDDDAPNDIIYVGEASENTEAAAAETRHTTKLTATIPSISSVTDSNTVGLKVIVYYYVDGALTSGKNENVLLGYYYTTPAEDSAYDPDVAYYEFEVKTLATGADLNGLYQENTATGDMEPASGKYASGTYYERKMAQLTAEDLNDEDMSDNGYYIVKLKATTTDGVTEYVPEPKYAELEYFYVRSADIPNTGSTLKIAFSAEVAAAE